MNKPKPITAGWILFVIYCVGFVGLSLQVTKLYVVPLTWVNLLVTLIVLLMYHKKWSKEISFALILVGAIGYFIEVVGVKTGLIFGYYQYGPTLGYALLDTPLMMAVNWIITIYITRQIAEMIAKDLFLISVLASLLMIILDYFIEPFAIQYGLWRWNRGEVPIHNYIGWFVCGLIIHYLFLKSVKFPTNKLALPIYVIQLAFFMGLYFIKYKVF